MRTQQLTRIALFLALALAIQLLRFPQPVTGPAINAILLLTCMFVSPWAAILIGCLTPGVALLFGITPPIIAPLLPFIMLSNALLVLIFYLFFRQVRNVHESLIYTAQPRDISQMFFLCAGVVLAAVGKFAFLFLTTRYLVQILHKLGVVKTMIPPQALLAFQLPQLYTALAGGALALILYRFLRNRINTHFKSLTLLCSIRI